MSNHLPCKHFFAVFQNFPGWRWDKLPDHYKTSPYLSLDKQAISSYIASDEGNQEEYLMIEQNEIARDEDVENVTSEIPRKVQNTCSRHPPPPYTHSHNTHNTHTHTHTHSQRKQLSIQNVAQEVRVTLKTITSLTYNCTEVHHDLLLDFNDKLKQMMSDFKANLPQEQGIILRPQLRKKLKLSHHRKTSKHVTLLCHKHPKGDKRNKILPFEIESEKRLKHFER